MRRHLAGLSIVAVFALALAGWPAVPAVAARSGGGPGTVTPSPVGKPWRAPATPAPKSQVLPQLTPPGTVAGVHALGVAAARARRLGRPVLVSALTTGTTQVWARPDDQLVVTERVLPVRVRHGRTWVPVSTHLVADPAGGWIPAAVPADSVRFSAGGSGPLAVLSGGGQSLKLWWPGALPSPAVAGSSATYRNVLPGVDLVLTATSVQTGGFSEVLVVRNAAAARDPRLAGLALRVSASAGQLARAAGGGLTVALPGLAGSFAAPAPVMWDSSVRPANSALPSRGAVASAAAVGATVAPIWSGPRSSSAGPGGGARVAPVGAVVSGRGTLLRLLPDRSLLGSPTTRYPVFIDPSFNWYPKTGDEQAYDPVQSDAGNSGIYGDTTNCTGSHYDSSGYKFSPMGYDNFEAGPCEFNDTDRALYRIGIPSVVVASDAHLHSADVQLTEVYTSSCSADPSVTVSWIGGISSSTGWGGPGKTSNDVDSSHSFGPDSGSCNSTENTGNRVSQGFSIMSDMSSIGSASNITIRVWEPSDTNDVNHKQLTDNPTIQFTYNDTPNVPSSLEEAATSSGSGSLACDSNATDPNLPIIGKTDATNGPYLLATYKDPDGDTVAGTAKYWNNATPSTTFSISAGSSLSGTGAAQIPASFTSNMANGTVIGWQAQATDSVYTSAWSGKCYFAVYPNDPDPPAVTAGFDQTQNQAVGAPLSFTITQSDTAKEFVWGLDKTPPTTGTIPAGQICDSTSTTCTLSSGKAVLTISAPSPGPHILWVYQQDVAGNDSGMATGALAGMVETFDVANDPAVSYTGGASLAANFAAALGAAKSFDNTMISNSSDASCGTSSGDGTGTDFVAGDLTSAGWQSGKTMTLDGTSFTLPTFGSCGVDNLLAANQTIAASSAGQQGSSLVFLAASSDGFATVPGLVTGSVDSVASETTAPAVMGGTRVTGTGCTGAIATDTTLQGMCVPASGVITYVPATGCPSTQSYDLTVPDWWSGPSDIAALTMPGVVQTGGAHTQTVKLYAFSVPLDASCEIASVTLPDVGDTARAAVTSGSSGVQESLPALHIFGVSLRNTTTATPQANGAAPASPSARAWTGAFEAPMENAFGPPSGVTWGNQTIRIWASPNISAAAGASIRIRLSFPGFLSADGTGPLQIGAVTIAQEYFGAAPAQTPVPLTFGGSASVTIPEGGDIYSDPITLPASFGTNPVTAGHGLLISLWVKNTSLPVLPLDSEGAGAGSWFAPSSTPNETTDTTGTPFTGTGSSSIGAVPILTGYDLTTPAATVAGTASPGAPTVVVTGNNIVDGWTTKAPSDTFNQPSQRLAGQLASQGLAPGFGVTDGSVEANRMLADSSFTGGPSLLARIDRDVLAEPDVGTVIIDQGLQDLLAQGGSTTVGPDLNNALAALVNQLNAYGINVIVGTLTPCAGFTDSATGYTCTTGTGATVDAARAYVNSVTSGISLPNCWADLDSAVSDNASPEALATSPTNFDSGDHANLSYAGFAALAPAVTNSGGFCALMPSMFPMPAVP
ncbi:MAG TPA: hypothetical protein VNF47_03980 [Streptosporangiaceae bacterium]|nr:hypothetical protein [Streptosporangiaceae bacterium]